MRERDYYVVLRCGNQTMSTVTDFESEQEFRKWYGGLMRDGTGRRVSAVHTIVAQGLTAAQAYSKAAAAFELGSAQVLAALGMQEYLDKRI